MHGITAAFTKRLASHFNVQEFSMGEAFSRLDKSELSRLQAIERLDEVEEFNFISAHYAFISATNLLDVASQ